MLIGLVGVSTALMIIIALLLRIIAILEAA